MRRIKCQGYFFCFLVIIVFSIKAIGQEYRYSEEEFRLQYKFIQAHKEKMLGKFEKAKELYLEVYKENRENHAAAYEISRVSDAMEDLIDAEKYIKIAIQLNPANEWYQRYYVQFLEENDRKEDAVNQYSEMVKRWPDHQGYYEKLASLHIALENHNEAIKLYDVLENRHGIQEQIIIKKVKSYDLLGKEKKAIAEFKKLIVQDPANTKYLNYLASYLKNIGKEKEAIKLYEKIIKIDPDDDAANIALTNARSSEAGPLIYLRSIRPLIKNPQISIDNKIMELIPYVESMDSDSNLHATMISLLEDLKNTHPTEAKAYAINGDGLLKVGKINKAIVNYKKTIELNNTVFSVWEQLMYAQAELGDFTELKATAEESLEYYPNQAICYYFYALAHHHLQNFVKADELLQESRFMAADNPTAQYKILFLSAQNSLAAGNAFRALDFANEALSKGMMEDPVLYELLGDIYMAQARLPYEELFMRNIKMGESEIQAEKHYQKAVALGADADRINAKKRSLKVIEE